MRAGLGWALQGFMIYKTMKMRSFSGKAFGLIVSWSIVGLIGSASLATRAQAQPELLDLNSAVTKALESNHDLKIAREQVEQSEAQARLATGGLLPTVALNLGAGYRKDSVASGAARFSGNAYNTYAGSLDLTQPLLRGSALWDGVGYYRKSLELSRLAYEIAERDETFEVMKAFYRVLLAQKLVETYERQEAALKILLGRARQRYAVGAERQLTVLQFQTRLAIATPQVTQARNNLETSGVQLLNLLGDRQSSEIRVKGDLDKVIRVPVEAETFSQELERPELRQERLLQEQFERQRGVVMAEHWPSLNLIGSVGRNGTTGGALFDENATQWSAGVNLSIPLFSGLTSFKQREVLASQGAQLVVREKKTRDLVVLERLQRARDLDSVVVVLKGQAEALSLAQQSFATAQRMYGLGTVTYATLFDTQDDLNKAELSYVQTQMTYLEALASKYIAYGKPLKELVQKISF